MLFRLLLLLGFAVGLSVFAWSNWGAMQLTFLGMQTPSLPLAMWVLTALAAGILTDLAIASLFGLSNQLAKRDARSQVRRATRRAEPSPSGTSGGAVYNSFTESFRPPDRSRDDTDWQDWEGYEQPRQAVSEPPQPSKSESDDDWEAETGDNWEEYDEQPATPRTENRRDVPTGRQRDRGYDERQEPKTTSRTGSAYSYGYREPRRVSPTEAGRSSPDSVVDAEYRVIVPPPRSPEPVSSIETDDDWFEDDDLETDEERRKRSL